MNVFSRVFVPWVLCCVVAQAAPKPLFDGKTFAGWEGDTEKVWRIEQGEIVAGRPDVKQARNEFLVTTRDYADFELTLRYRRGSNNGGVQIRSERVPNHHEMKGYQADFAPGIDGFLYDESRRNRFLALFDIEKGPMEAPPEGTGAAIKRANQTAKEVSERLKLGEWNHYRIRCEGPRIQLWVNDVQTVDFTEKDGAIPLKGKIGVQIHGGATEIRYKDIQIEELGGEAPKSQAAGNPMEVRKSDTVALVGGSNIERTRFHGFLQVQLIGAVADGGIRVRNFGWEGDTVFEQWRDAGSTDPSKSWRQQRDWREQLREAGATLVLAQFGQMESLRGEAGLGAFVAAYEGLVREFMAEGRRVVLMSPTRFEGAMESHNAALKIYADSVRTLAARLGVGFVDLTGIVPEGAGQALTENGWQWNEAGHRAVASSIGKALKIGTVVNEAARREILEAERLWFDYWRPMNWAFLTGDRTGVAYSKDWKDASKRIFPQEMQDFLPLLDRADANVWAAFAGKPAVPVGVRSSIPVESGAVAPQTPEEELASFKVAEGFEVNLFASERDGIVKPIQMRWDERGRLWVACAVSYPQIKPGEKANDYVLVCEDTDGDGRADKFHKFVEGLFMPSGIELGDGGIYVAQGTELLHFKDTDGDGRADAKRIVLGGFGTADSHQMINGLNWGFGGELWFTQGHHIYSRVETPFGVETLNRAGIWRWRPRTGHLDPFFQFSSAGANCWGVFTTEYGQPFHKSGANSGAWFCTPGLVRSSLAVNAQAMNLFHAPIKQVGMEFLRSSHFPEEMQGRAVIGGYYANLLEWHTLKRENGVFRSERLPNLIETKNNVFRPVEVRNGPDGAIYLADWYNPIIGHYQASYRHPDRDKQHGRIWRVTMKGRPLAKRVDLGRLSVAGLLEHVDSPEGWAQYQAKRLLFGRATSEVVPALDAWVSGLAKDGLGAEYRRLQALALFEAHETVRPELLKRLLRAETPDVRAYATRVLSTWVRDGRLPEALGLLEVQVADDDALVRLEAVVAASYVADVRAAAIAARALDKDFNPYHQHALTKTLHVLNRVWAPEVDRGGTVFDRDEHLLFALQNGWVENNPEDFRSLSGAAVAYRPSPNARAAAIMKAQVTKNAGNPERMLRWLRAFAGIASAEDVPFLMEHGSRDPSVLGAIKTAKPDGAEHFVKMLFSDPSAPVRGHGARLAGLWKLGVLLDVLRPLADDSHPFVREQAVGALLAIEPERGVEKALKLMGVAKDVREITGAMGAILGRADTQALFVKALSKGDAVSPSAARLGLQALNLAGKADPRVAQALMGAAGMNTALPPYTKDYIGKVVKAAQTVGDAVEGKKVYEMAGCATCHMPGAAQSRIGPDLSAISRGLPIDMIVTEVVWPGLNVKENFEAANVVLKDGSVVTGFKHTDTAEAIAVRELTGSIRTIKKSDAQSIKVGGTLMPEGLTGNLNETQLAHLIRYLSELGK
jgi:putative heme-binding domain-containing protein